MCGRQSNFRKFQLEGLMKKCHLLIIALGIMLLCFANDSLAWQGRMSGMDNPSGLVSDESDILIHPSKIADGSGSNYYADYKFNYIHVPKWDNIMTNSLNGVRVTQYPFKASGSERDHDASLGGTWAFGPGRIGIFLNYSDKSGSYVGTNNFPTPLTQGTFALHTDADSIAVRLLYGLPIGSWKLGTEIGFAHKSHDNSTFQSYSNGFRSINTSEPIGAYDLSAFLMPLDASWNEASFKASVEKTAGPGVLTFTPRIATVFHGENNVNFRDTSGPVVVDNVVGTGTIKGWSTGADLWYRVRLNDTTSLPFLMSVSYDRKRSYVSTVDITTPDTEINEAKQLVFETGGGIDKDISGMKIASGLYYDYVQSKTHYDYTVGGQEVAHNDFPSEKEHRIVWKTAVERGISSNIIARAGLNAFYGWLADHYNYTDSFNSFGLVTQDMRASGHRWGLSASAGATVKVAKLDFEPFITGGLQKTSLDTDNGFYTQTVGSLNFTADLQSRKSEWNIGGGLSIKY